MLISALMLYVIIMLVMLLRFSVLSSIPYAIALSTKIVGEVVKFIILPPIKSMSSANCRLHKDLTPMEMDVWWSYAVVSCMIFSRNKLKKMGESKHPWRIPTVVLKNFPRKLHCWSSHMVPEWLEPPRSSSMLKLLRTCHRPACQTLSNAFLKTKKLWNKSHWCCMCCFMMTRLLKVCSTVLRPGLKLACSSASSSSALSLSRLRTTRSMILLGWLIRLMVRQFWNWSRLPFFEKGMTSDYVHSFGHPFFSQILWQIWGTREMLLLYPKNGRSFEICWRVCGAGLG